MYRSAKYVGGLWVIICLLSSCKPSERKEIDWKSSARYVHELNEQLSEAIIQDGFTPPVASRSYAYANIAGYEALQPASPDYRSLAGQINGLEQLPQPEAGKIYDFRVSMVRAFCRMGVEVVYRDHILDKVEEKLLTELKAEIVDEKIYNESVEFGDKIAAGIKEWASKDNYKQTRTMPRFQPSKIPGKWVPTPPSYGDAIEPHWMKMRTLVLDSARQFANYPCEVFSTDKNSAFYGLANHVYEAVNHLTDEEKIIARFWDCNPQVTVSRAHLMGVKRQLTPGGHWMGIAGTAARYADADAFATSETYTRVAIGLYDTFISVWATKYQTDLIRPETYINLYIDPDWRPFLETPMFPEHTSGHSAISRSSSTVLTLLYGENFAYVDSVNVPFNNPARTYGSFYQASDEAAMSRVFGGIHYEPARILGIQQGSAVGNWTFEHLKFKN